MPIPKKKEKKEDFIARCIKELIQEEGRPLEESQAICYNIYDNKKGGINEIKIKK